MTSPTSQPGSSKNSKRNSQKKSDEQDKESEKDDDDKDEKKIPRNKGTSKIKNPMNKSNKVRHSTFPFSPQKILNYTLHLFLFRRKK